MCDQLRADHLSCAGHPHLKTPPSMRWPSRGVRFPRAYVQSGVCGPIRMSYYTGRYMFSHGATWNRVPLSLREKTIGDLPRARRHQGGAGRQDARPARSRRPRALRHRGRLGARRAAARRPLRGDRPLRRPLIRRARRAATPTICAQQGYNSDDPWTDYVIAADGPNGETLSGWHMRNVHLPARVKEEHSETAYMTREAMRFMDEQGDKPWCLHLCYVKPHWPYMAPAPYHDMYGAADMLPLNRDEQERVGRASRAGRLSRARGIDLLLPPRGARHRAAGLHGPDQADRRLAGPPVRPHGEELAASTTR